MGLVLMQLQDLLGDTIEEILLIIEDDMELHNS